MRIIDLIKQHESYRRNCINLIPSENVMSMTARKALMSDLVHRYHHKDFYGGQRYIQEIIEETRELLLRLFNAKIAFPEPLSGNISLLSAIIALSDPGDKIAIISPNNGGYPINLNAIHRRPIYLPYNKNIANIDVERSIELINRERPKIVILGASFILFPQPVKELSDVVKNIGSIMIYDASHVLGLIAGKQFQDPLREGADILLGSTHKTFPGPQGGVILTNNEELASRISEVIKFPPVLVDNPHINRIAALGITTQEMILYGEEYAREVIRIARKIGKDLYESGIEVSFHERNYTHSHQIWVRVNEDKGKEVKDMLEKARIIIDSGVRIGSQEITRRGIRDNDLTIITNAISKIMKGNKPEKYERDMILLASKLNNVKYSLDEKLD